MIRWAKPGLAVLCWGMTMAAHAQDAQAPAPTGEPQDAAAQVMPDPFVEPVAEASPVAETPTIPVEPLAVTAAPDTVSEPRNTTQLEEIIVTATKRAQSVRDIPVSITALTGEKLEKMGAQELKDFIQLVPGINSQDEIAGIQRKLSIRGVGPDTGTNQTVGTVYGDVPLSDPYGSFSIADPGPWDLETVEVLKGPQGTLFGATSLAGLIRYVPNSPELGLWSGRFSADWVSVKDGGAEPTFGAVLNAPLGDSVAVRLSGSWQHKPGLIDMDNPVRQETDADDSYSRTGRAMVLWQPTDRLRINAWHVRGGRESEELSYLTNPDGEPVRDDAVRPSPVDNRYTLSTLDARYEFDWASLVSITGYQTKYSFTNADSSYLVRPLAQAGIRSLQARRTAETSGWLQELRLVSPDDGPWTWLGGLFYSTYTADISAALYVNPDLPLTSVLFDLFPGGLAGLPIDENGIKVPATSFHPLEAGEKALFGELTRAFGDHWSLTLGGRFYEAEVNGTPDGSDEELTSVGKGFSPKASLTYRLDRDLMFYATVSRGFQYGGFNLGGVGPNTDPPTFKSSTLMNHELGMRSDWLERTLRFDLTALYVMWKDPQVRQPSTNYGVESPAGGFIDNVGEVRSVGAETTLRYITPLPGLTFEVAASYIDARTTVPYVNATGDTIPTGTEMPSSPKVQTSSTISYVLNLGNWMTQTALAHTYQAGTFNNIEHDVEVGDYQLFGVNFTVSRIDLPYAPSLSIGVNNLTDERSVISALGGSDTLPGYPELSEALVPRPRVFTLPRTLRLNFTLNFE